MADDIIIKFSADDKNLVKTLKDLVNAQKKLIGQTNKAATAINKASASFKKLETNTKKANTGIVNITNNGRLLNNAFATMRSKLLLVSFAFGLVARGVGKNIEGFATQEESVARLALQFGSAAAGELDEYSSKLQEITRFGDENINVVMSQFGAFGANIEQTKRLTMATIDLAEGQGMDLNAAALLVAKSMGSSTNALSRYGIEIDTSASKSEKAAQLISGISAKYGGLGEVLGGLAGSELVKLKNSFSDLTESLGETLATGLNPIIGAFKSLSDATSGLPIRLLTQAVISLTAAFVSLRLVGMGSAFIKATQLASAHVSKINANLRFLGLGAMKTSKAISIFARTLIGSTAGIGGMVAVVGTALFALAELTGWFKTSKEETAKAGAAIDKYAGKLKLLDTGEAVENLSEFYLKIADGNELLKLSITNLDTEVNLLEELNDALKATLKLPEELPESFKQNLQSQLKTLETSLKTGWEIEYKWTEEQGQSFQMPVDVQIKPERMAEIKKEIDEINFKLNPEPILIQANFKEAFTEVTGVSDRFFNTFIEGTAVVDALQQGAITTNKDLFAVLDKVVGSNEEFRKMSIEKQTALINEIILSGELQTTKEGELAQIEKEKSARKLLLDTFHDTKAGREELFDTQIKFLNQMKEQNLLSAQELEWLELLIAKREEYINGKKKEIYVNKIISDERLNQISQFGSAIATIAGENKELAIAGMRISQFAATVSAIEGGIRLFGDSGNWAEALVATAVALAHVATIEAQIQGARGVSVGGNSAGSFKKYGGLVGGNRHLDGGTLIEAEQGEFVMSRKAVQSIGLKGLNELNRGGSSGGINVTVTGNVLTQDFVEGELAESIKEAVRRGSDFGIG